MNKAKNIDFNIYNHNSFYSKKHIYWSKDLRIQNQQQ